MPVIRYKNRPITPVDAVVWNGGNITEVQAVCPQVEIPDHGSMLTFPGPSGPVELYVSEVIMKNVAGGTYTKLSEDVFVGLYMPQEGAQTQPAGE